jgi:hypothetical protein
MGFAGSRCLKPCNRGPDIEWSAQSGDQAANDRDSKRFGRPNSHEMEPDHGVARRTGPVEAGRGSSHLLRYYPEAKHRAKFRIQRVPNPYRTPRSYRVGVTVLPRCHSPVPGATIPQSQPLCGDFRPIRRTVCVECLPDAAIVGYNRRRRCVECIPMS